MKWIFFIFVTLLVLLGSFKENIYEASYSTGFSQSIINSAKNSGDMLFGVILGISSSQAIKKTSDLDRSFKVLKNSCWSSFKPFCLIRVEAMANNYSSNIEFSFYFDQLIHMRIYFDEKKPFPFLDDLFRRLGNPIGYKAFDGYISNDPEIIKMASDSAVCVIGDKGTGVYQYWWILEKTHHMYVTSPLTRRKGGGCRDFTVGAFIDFTVKR